MDALLLRALVREISTRTRGGRISRVDQPGHYSVLLTVRKPGDTCKVLLSADPRSPGAYITRSSFDLPKQAPAFCMLLRKRLEGGKVECCEALELERVCLFRVVSRDDLGNPAVWTLVLEATGRNPNVLLLDPESRVVAQARRSAASSVGRDQSIGSVYSAPASPDKTHPKDVSPSTFAGTDMPCEQAVLRTVAGFGRTLAGEACKKASVCGSLDAAVRAIWDESLAAKTGTVFMDAAGTPLDVHVVRLTLPGVHKSFDSPSDAVDEYYGRITRDAALSTTRQSLQQSVKSAIARISRRLASRIEELDEAAAGEKHRKAGDLILTYLPEVRASLEARRQVVTFQDPETGENVPVQLDLSLDAAANAQLQYKKYTRLKARLRMLAPLVERDKNDLAYLETVAEALDRAEELDALNDIGRELRDQGFIRQKRSPAGAATPKPRARSLRLVTSDGHEILAGASNRQNEYVTFKAASRNDLWFHAKAVPGAHVILRSKDGTAAEAAILEAATIAATLSKARTATKVEVDFTHVRNVKKTPGSRPGMVLYDDYQTIVVRPDPDLAKRLRRD